MDFLKTIVEREDTSGFKDLTIAWISLKEATNYSQNDIGLLTVDLIINIHSQIYPKAKDLCTHIKAAYFEGIGHFYPHFLNQQIAKSALQLLVDLNNQVINKIKNHKDLRKCACKFIFTLSSLHLFCDANGRTSRLFMAYILKRGYKNWLTFTCSQPEYVRALTEDRKSTPYLQREIITTEQEARLEVLNLYNNPCDKLLSILNQQIINQERKPL